MNSNMVTCSFVMDRNTYNAFKSIVSRQGQNVKGSLVRYMQSVIQYDTPNADTIAAIKEVEDMKKNPNATKSYSSFKELLVELEANGEL